MIKMQLDLSDATPVETEAFLALPHVAGAIDVLSHVKKSQVKLVLIVNEDSQSDNESLESVVGQGG